ncbi:MAG: ATP-binding cassette domain-containing protein, partial [Bacillota bacterium]|nr:ATP-binding cassette domain-containing protein [Bacillota bacterium]
DRAPKDRDIAMVFQNYALYAHMTVYHNMAFSLVLRRENSDHIHERVMWAAELLGLIPYLNRKPAQLSGGQRQRVALGRAIVRDPKIFLLDEPLSNLDAKLRASMRKELKELQHRLNATMVYVTHDQIEALTLADRVVIMKDGDVQQIGTPLQVYADPANLFVANFIGMPPMNVFTVRLDGEGNLRLATDAFAVTDHPAFATLCKAGYCGRELVMGVRPEHIRVLPATSAEGFDTVCDIYELLGSEALVHFAIGDAAVTARVKDTADIAAKTPMKYRFDVEHVFFFDKETGVRIHA